MGNSVVAGSNYVKPQKTFNILCACWVTPSLNALKLQAADRNVVEQRHYTQYLIVLNSY